MYWSLGILQGRGKAQQRSWAEGLKSSNQENFQNTNQIRIIPTPFDKDKVFFDVAEQLTGLLLRDGESGREKDELLVSNQVRFTFTTSPLPQIRVFDLQEEDQIRVFDLQEEDQICVFDLQEEVRTHAGLEGTRKLPTEKTLGPGGSAVCCDITTPPL